MFNEMFKIKIDGKSVVGIKIEDVVKKLRGKPGTKVAVTILRKNEKARAWKTLADRVWETLEGIERITRKKRERGKTKDLVGKRKINQNGLRIIGKSVKIERWDLKNGGNKSQ